MCMHNKLSVEKTNSKILKIRLNHKAFNFTINKTDTRQKQQARLYYIAAP